MRRLLPALLLACAPGAAHAAGFYFTDSGTRAIGRGSAIVASVDDLSALYHNPGALARMRQAQAFVSFSGVDQYVEFDRLDEPDEGLEFDPITNSGPFMLVPALGVSGSLGVPRTTFALGFISPQAPDPLYPQDGAQRYSLTDELLWEFAGVAGAGVQITDWLAVGATFQARMLRAQMALAVATSAGDDPAQDIDLGFEIADWFAPNWSAGVIVDPLGWLTIGASYQPATHYHARGDISADFAGHVWEGFLDGTHFVDDDVSAEITMPAIARVGLDFHPSDRWDVEVAGAWEGWHVWDEVVITDVDLTIKVDPDGFIPQDAVVTNDVVIPAAYQDVWSARLGGRYDVHRLLTLRAGGFYETSAVPRTYQGVTLVDGDKIGMGLGAGGHFGRFDVDLGFGEVWFLPRDIDDSELQQLVLDIDLAHPEESVVGKGKVVGNGHFSSRLTYLSMAATWKFGKAPS
ncbi:MAG: outer membrane protein transport protein [Pseudomonadota bacterium]